jgi:polyisoprenoid-binding protein YceI
MRRLFTAVLLAFICSSYASAQNSYEITSSQIFIAGTSNVHDWKSEATKAEASGAMTIEAATLKSIKSLTVTIPVGGIKSTKGSIMDKKTWSALQKDKHPNITYNLTKVNNLSKNGDSYDIKTTGNLTIAGETRSIEMTVKGKVIGNDIQFEGSKKMKMTDFKIDPPTALMGTMKTGDDITISFYVKLTKTEKVTNSK